MHTQVSRLEIQCIPRERDPRRIGRAALLSGGDQGDHQGGHRERVCRAQSMLKRKLQTDKLLRDQHLLQDARLLALRTEHLPDIGAVIEGSCVPFRLQVCKSTQFFCYSPQDVFRKFGLPSDSKLDNILLIYLHLKETLPGEFLEFLDAKTQIDLDIGAQVSFSEAKEARKQLRARFETNSVHVRLDRGRASDLAPAVTAFLNGQDLQFERVIGAGRSAIVQMKYHADIFPTVERLQSARLDPGVVVTASRVEVKAAVEGVTERRPPKKIDPMRVGEAARAHAEALQEAGFFQLAERAGGGGGKDEEGNAKPDVKRHFSSSYQFGGELHMER